MDQRPGPMPIWPKGLPKNMNNCGLPVVVVVPPLQILDSDKKDILLLTEEDLNFADDKSDKR